ncbi:MAG: phosphodiester glycosidase family protein [Deinococcus sp.]
MRASLGGASLVRLDASSPVRLVQETLGREKVALLIGGLPVTHHVHWRSSVGQFIRAAGGVAGVNGTFFKDAAIASNDSNMMGPLLTPDGVFLSESDPVLLGKISGRPLVAWSRGQFLVTSFVPRRMNHRADVKALLPGVTDAFAAGAWLVRGGQALRPAARLRYAASDAQQVRPRVFFGVTRGGQPIAGATITPVSSVRLAQIAQAAGAQEAVMLDGGYSTSLIYCARALAVGHSSRKTQSRPVPHAIVFMAPLLANAPLPRASLPRPAVSNVQLASKRLPAAQLADEQRSAAQRSTGQRSKRRLPAGPLASRATGETEDASTPR